MEAYLQFAVAVLVGLEAIGFSSWRATLSSVFVILVFALVVGFVVWIPWFVHRNSAKLVLGGEKFFNSCWAVFDEFKQKSKVTVLHNLVFTARRLGYAIILVFLGGHPLAQAIIFVFLTLPNLGYLIVFRPYILRSHNILMTINESSLVACAFGFFFFTSPSSSQQPIIVGWVLVGMIVLLCIFNFLYIYIELMVRLFLLLVDGFLVLKKSWSEEKKKKVRIQIRSLRAVTELNAKL